jgi:hypothetical protein
MAMDIYKPHKDGAKRVKMSYDLRHDANTQYPKICLEGVRKTIKCFNQDCDLDSNPPKYYPGPLPLESMS